MVLIRNRSILEQEPELSLIKGLQGKRGRFPGTQVQQNKPPDGQITPSL